MSEPTELENQIYERLKEVGDDTETPTVLRLAQEKALLHILDELVERRLRMQYLGREAVTGISERQERID